MKSQALLLLALTSAAIASPTPKGPLNKCPRRPVHACTLAQEALQCPCVAPNGETGICSSSSGGSCATLQPPPVIAQCPKSPVPAGSCTSQQQALQCPCVALNGYIGTCGTAFGQSCDNLQPPPALTNTMS